jgi:hypothetical protein
MSENNSILILGNLLSPIWISKNTTGRVNPAGASGGAAMVNYQWLLSSRLKVMKDLFFTRSASAIMYVYLYT